MPRVDMTVALRYIRGKLADIEEQCGCNIGEVNNEGLHCAAMIRVNIEFSIELKGDPSLYTTGQLTIEPKTGNMTLWGIPIQVNPYQIEDYVVWRR